VTRVSVNQCAQCQADIIAPEWSEHLSDYCIRHVWSCDACGYRFEDTVTCRVSWRTRHRAWTVSWHQLSLLH
jgi:C4-type Zn-finger protein